jgi:hypothetical protein
MNGRVLAGRALELEGSCQYSPILGKRDGGWLRACVVKCVSTFVFYTFAVFGSAPRGIKACVFTRLFFEVSDRIRNGTKNKN